MLWLFCCLIPISRTHCQPVHLDRAVKSLKLIAFPANFLFCREALLSYITTGDDVQVSGSLSMLATLLQTKGYISGLLFFSFRCFAPLLQEPLCLQSWKNQCLTLLEFFHKENNRRNSCWYVAAVNNHYTESDFSEVKLEICFHELLY